MKLTLRNNLRNIDTLAIAMAFFLDKWEVFKSPGCATVGLESFFFYTSVSNKLLSMIEIV